eukprot:CAMPEP_0113858384 /NCGR_PEP_ID=MMETSP0372-20130328/11193_1 /TAXON_ID=340204 /ORGANISM="Lankesteria abbotti" /LENGTH=60 /DNA_ID=CAMNT_0000835353 /DNA_START=71 /DNA_END=250 /DNA_ORIENTATION=- /assembly_acc=CAM_ASM_000359
MSLGWRERRSCFEAIFERATATGEDDAYHPTPSYEQARKILGSVDVHHMPPEAKAEFWDD